MAKRKTKPAPPTPPESVAFDALAARRALLDQALASIEGADCDKRAPLIREARALIAEIAGPGTPVVKPDEAEVSGVVDFQAKLARRRAKPKDPDRRRTGG